VLAFPAGGNSFAMGGPCNAVLAGGPSRSAWLPGFSALIRPLETFRWATPLVALVLLVAALLKALRAERQRLEAHWQQRLERACYEAERARRQHAALEPENRLVVRALERRWETALQEQRKLEADRSGIPRAQTDHGSREASLPQ
jgi:hypothetical protein